MLKGAVHILSFMLLFFTGIEGAAQSGFYIPKKGKIFFKGDTATIFSDVINYGKVGVGKDAVVNFSGTTWTNASTAAIINETDTVNGYAGKSGLVRFLSTSYRQQLDAGYNAAVKTGAIFQYLHIDNPFGMELIGSSAKITNELVFKNGLVYLNGQMLTIGDGMPGSIKGYDSSKYFVAVTGMLIREGITSNDDWITFPVGTKEHSYTPAALRSYSEVPDDYYVSVFDSVRAGVISGNEMMKESVGKTWRIGKRFLPGQGNVELVLQHVNSDEGSVFKANKTKSYLSQFTNNSWDVNYPQNYPGTGYLTTSSPLQNSGTNSRQLFANLMSTSYFTKLTGAGDTTHTRLWFNAYRLNTADVKVYWTTQPEINIKYFVVQRRLANEAVFKNIDTVSSVALNGYSRQPLYYEMVDPNGYKGISFYRLLSVEYNRDSSYSQIVAVGNKWGEFQSELWPNPASDVFYLSLNTAQPVKEIIIWNELGQKVMVQQTGGQRVIQVNVQRLAQAHYYVSLIGELNTILETKKLIIVR